jgi:DNA-binding CsgD family transcriptional regulator
MLETAEVAAEAIAAGLTKREIARLAAISRPTLDAILRRSE